LPVKAIVIDKTVYL